MPGRTAEAEQDLLLLVGRIDGNVSRLLEHQRGHDTRIMRLERDRWTFFGLLAGITALVSREYVHPLVALFTGAGG